MFDVKKNWKVWLILLVVVLIPIICYADLLTHDLTLKQEIGGAAAGATVIALVAATGGTALLALGAGLLAASIANWFLADKAFFAKILEAFQSIDNGCWFCGVFEKLFNFGTC